MKKEDKLVIVDSASGDWCGLYRNGILLIEGHSLPIPEVLKLLGFEIEEKEAQEDWLEYRGSLPELLKDVEF